MKITKRLILMMLTLVVIFSLFTMTASANGEIKVLVNGQQLQFDVPPQTVNYRTMVPVRAIFEALGARVDWYEDTQTIIATGSDGKIVSLTLNSNTMYVHGTPVTLDAPAYETGGRTLVPVRAISEAFGSKVDWYEDTQTVAITSVSSAPSEPVNPAPVSRYTESFDKLYNLIISKGTNVKDGIYCYTYNSSLNVSFYAGTLNNDKVIFISTGGDSIDITLYLEDENSIIGHPWVVIKYNGTKTLEVDYERNGQVKVVEGNMTQTSSETLNSLYNVFDMIIGQIGSDVKISDFGIYYTPTSSTPSVPSAPQKSRYATSYDEVEYMLKSEGSILSDGSYARMQTYDDGGRAFMSWDAEDDYLGFSYFSSDDESSISVFVYEDETEPVGVVVAIGSSRFMISYENGRSTVIKNDFGSSYEYELRELVGSTGKLIDLVLSGWGCSASLSDFGVNY